MTRLNVPKSHTPPQSPPRPGPPALPVQPDQDPTPELLPDDPNRDGVIQPVA